MEAQTTWNINKAKTFLNQCSCLDPNHGKLQNISQLNYKHL